MTWADLLNRVASDKYGAHARVEKILRRAFLEIAREIEDGGRVPIPKFGVFIKKVRKQRRIRNLSGEMIHLKKGWAVGFRASKHTKG